MTLHFTRLLGTAIAAVLLASACSGGSGDDAHAGHESSDTPAAVGLTQAELEKQVGQSYQPKDADTDYSIACEGDLAEADDADQDCLVTTEGKEVGVRAVVSDAGASDLGLELTPYLPAEVVAGSIAESLEIQGYDDVEAVCDGDLPGIVGERIVCTMSLAEGDTDVDVEVSSVDALQIDYTFKSA